MLFAFLEFDARVDQPINPKLKTVAVWYERMQARPSVKA
jgi:hypothetical protein